MRKNLIIGGAGYVGSYLMNSIEGENHSIDLGLYSNILKSDVIDYSNLSKSFIKKFDNVILLAGHSSFKMAGGTPISVFNNNVRNFTNLVSKISPDQTLIYASSASVYGNSSRDKITEDCVFETPYNMYDATKQMIDNYYLASGIRGRIFGLRFGTVNGYSPNTRTDVMLNAMVFSGVKKKEVLVYNSDTRRSILGIVDLSGGINKILNSSVSTGGIFNMSSFDSTSGKMAEYVSKKIGCNLKSIDTKTNTNIVSSKYDFVLSCDKFSKTFDYEFKESMESVVDSLIYNSNNLVESHRNDVYEYGG